MLAPPARGSRAAGKRVTRRPGRAAAACSTCRCPATRQRGAVHRRREPARRLRADRPRRRAEPDAHRLPRRARPHGRAPQRAAPATARRRAGRRPGDAAAELVATRSRPARCRGSWTRCRCSRSSPAWRAATTIVLGAEELRVKETDRVAAVVDALRPLGLRVKAPDDGFRIRGVPARPRGGHGGRRAATTASRCSARWRASSPARASRIEDAEAVAVSFPGFWSSSTRSPSELNRDRRHRRARRRGQEHGRAAARASGSASATSTRARCTAR